MGERGSHWNTPQVTEKGEEDQDWIYNDRNREVKIKKLDMIDFQEGSHG